MITLYGPRRAPFTEKVLRALRLKRLEFRLVEPERPEDYRRWSPRTGLLPAIVIDGERVEDSTAICLRLDEIHPDPPLLSSDPRTAAAQRNLEEWVDESFIWYWMKWQRIRPDQRPDGPPVRESARESDPQPDREGDAAGARETRRRRGARLALPSWLGRHIRRSNDAEPAAARLVAEIDHRLEDLVRLLSDRPFFYSSQISLADLGVYSMLRIMADDGIPGAGRQVQRHTTLVDFMKRVEEATGGAST